MFGQMDGGTPKNWGSIIDFSEESFVEHEKFQRI